VVEALRRDDTFAMAHIRGGGLTENLPRVLPSARRDVIRKESWEVPGIFRFLRQEGNIPKAEMFRQFCMGMGAVSQITLGRAAIGRQTSPMFVTLLVGPIILHALLAQVRGQGKALGGEDRKAVGAQGCTVETLKD
jgi:hypothetical protein